MAVLVEVALDVIGVVAMRGVLRGPWRGRRGRREGLEEAGETGMEGVVYHSEYIESMVYYLLNTPSETRTRKSWRRKSGARAPLFNTTDSMMCDQFCEFRLLNLQ